MNFTTIEKSLCRIYNLEFLNFELTHVNSSYLESVQVIYIYIYIYIYRFYTTNNKIFLFGLNFSIVTKYPLEISKITMTFI